MIRVALLAPSLQPGGAERQMMYLAEGMPRDAFDLRFILMSERGPLAAEAEARGIQVDVLGIRPDSCHGIRPGCAATLVRATRRYRGLVSGVDIVDAWTVPAYTFAGFLRPIAPVPVVMAGRRSLPDVARTRTWYRELARTAAMRGVDAVVANSQAAGTAAVTVEGIDPARVHVIRNAVTIPVMTSATRTRLRHAWGLGPEEVVAGCVAELKPGKGHDLILDVAADLRGRHPSLRFVLVGKGALLDRLSRRVQAEGLADVVVIDPEQSDARSVYGALDIVVQASETEGLPNAVLEAAAAGRAIVATDVGGTSEIVTSDLDGLLVGKNDRGALSAAISLLVDRPDLRESLGTAASKRAGEFSPEALIEQTSALYRQLLAGARTGR